MEFFNDKGTVLPNGSVMHNFDNSTKQIRNHFLVNSDYLHQISRNWPTVLRCHALNKCAVWTDGQTNENAISLPHSSQGKNKIMKILKAVKLLSFRRK